ncbi:MAG: hypothetical protein UY72_C0044G0007 [Candidatus Uhrbacteria bacterium GW2011_GWD2_52_7]|uniref:Uncharacterized protein n=1 Tax=Candidatus Uhrbacteria bacterium GW2011_GWD2_52_7 TaxID=1618989 RepID=A0A0G1XEX1_9BACT|nr:MAG: hypothetical protein UY72_C0044G0007 [Candidatus Uhrbacteria bacterium GW2011_GWD2_52_7]
MNIFDLFTDPFSTMETVDDHEATMDTGTPSDE